MQQHVDRKHFIIMVVWCADYSRKEIGSNAEIPSISCIVSIGMTWNLRFYYADPYHT